MHNKLKEDEIRLNHRQRADERKQSFLNKWNSIKNAEPIEIPTYAPIEEESGE